MRVTRVERPAWASEWRSGSSRQSEGARALATLLLALLVGCGGEKEQAAAAPADTGDSPVVVESPSMEFLPRAERAPGWVLMGEPEVYPAQQAETYLGLETQHYRDYDLTDLTVGEYDRPDRAGRATVEIFRFPDYVKAFGAYSTRGVEGAPLGLENASIVGRHAALAWSGPFVVRVVSLAGPADSEPIRGLAAAVVTAMPKAPGPPAVFQFFPDQNRVPGSEKYVAGPVFGQPYLARGFVAAYEAGGEKIEGMILPAPSKETATEVLNRFKLLFATNGRLLDPIPNLGEDNFVGEDRYLGRTVAYRIDRFVVAFQGYGETQPLIDLAIGSNQRILNSILQQLRAAEKAAAAERVQRQQSAPRPTTDPPVTQPAAAAPETTPQPATAPPPAAEPPTTTATTP